MDEYIKQSIEGRKMAFTNSYELTSEYEDKVKKLFVKIEKLGMKCSDVMDFEKKFMASSLNEEYTNLFTEISTHCKPIILKNYSDSNVKSDKEYLKDEILSEVKYIAKDLTMPVRRKEREEFDKKMRDTPLGKIEQASNTINVFRRLFKK